MFWSKDMEKTKLIFVTEDTINSKSYTQILTDTLLPITKKHYKRSYTFQQDNALIYTSKSTKKNFEREKHQNL